MLARHAFLIATVFLGMPAEADDTFCEGRQPIEHDDGRYHFSHESWVRSSSGAEFYGRCVKVLPPTTELYNHWVGVLPRAVARTGRPTKGGNSYIDRQTVDASAPLRYGHAGTEIPNAAFFAHRDEQFAPVGTETETRNPSYYDVVIKQIEDKGTFFLENEFLFSFLINDEDPASLADIDIEFVSGVNEEQFYYLTAYSLKIPADYQDAGLSLGFSGQALSQILREATGEITIPLMAGAQKYDFEAFAPNGQADFVRNTMVLMNSDQEVITYIPITYVLPPE